MGKDESLSALKQRYVNGEVSRKKYLEMKADIGGDDDETASGNDAKRPRASSPTSASKKAPNRAGLAIGVISLIIIVLIVLNSLGGSASPNTAAATAASTPVEMLFIQGSIPFQFAQPSSNCRLPKCGPAYYENFTVPSGTQVYLTGSYSSQYGIAMAVLTPSQFVGDVNQPLASVISNMENAGNSQYFVYNQSASIDDPLPPGKYSIMFYYPGNVTDSLTITIPLELMYAGNPQTTTEVACGGNCSQYNSTIGTLNSTTTVQGSNGQQAQNFYFNLTSWGITVVPATMYSPVIVGKTVINPDSVPALEVNYTTNIPDGTESGSFVNELYKATNFTLTYPNGGETHEWAYGQEGLAPECHDCLLFPMPLSGNDTSLQGTYTLTVSYQGMTLLQKTFTITGPDMAVVGYAYGTVDSGFHNASCDCDYYRVNSAIILMYNSGDTPIWVNYSDAWIGAPGEPDRDLFAYFQSVNAGWMMPKTCAEIVGGAATDEFLPATYILSTVFYNNQGLTIASSKNMITVPSGSVAVSNPTYDNSSCVRSLYEP